MNAASEPMPTTRIAIIVSPDGPIDAGAAFSVVGEIACSPARDLAGQTVHIMNGDGAVIATGEVMEAQDDASRTNALSLRAPAEIGEHAWRLALPAHVAGGVAYGEVTEPFVFSVKPHATSVAVWDVPSAVPAGETFSVTIGVKCSSACHPAGWTVDVLDHDGEHVATATPSETPWPGTAALYVAQVTLEAPKTEGLHQWRASAPGSGHEHAHEPRATEFGVRVVAQPEVVLRVEAIDAESQTPVKGAKVVAHPYRAFTDERGVAEIKVAKGEYTIFVSGRRHIPFRTLGAVRGDTTVRAGLSPDVGLSDADIWA